MKLRHYLLLGLAGSLVIGVALGAFVLSRAPHFVRPPGLAGASDGTKKKTSQQQESAIKRRIKPEGECIPLHPPFRLWPVEKRAIINGD